ncbi:hypothetical protein ABNX41_21150, partial [Rhodobacteraceae bacterium PA1-206B]
MSWKVANLCAQRKFGSPVRKQIIMFLADKASDDGSGIWCSKGTIQRHTELGETTVKRTINKFLSEGILIETGRRACTGLVAPFGLRRQVSLSRLSSAHSDSLGRAEGCEAVHVEQVNA